LSEEAGDYTRRITFGESSRKHKFSSEHEILSSHQSQRVNLCKELFEGWRVTRESKARDGIPSLGDRHDEADKTIKFLLRQTTKKKDQTQGPASPERRVIELQIMRLSVISFYLQRLKRCCNTIAPTLTRINVMQQSLSFFHLITGLGKLSAFN